MACTLPLPVIARRVREEITTRQHQGYQTDGLLAEWDAACQSLDDLLVLYQRIQKIPMQPDWHYTEPSDLQSIRDQRPMMPILPALYLSEIEIKNKIYGAWLGRIAGCVLGKPLEVGFSMQQIHDYLAGANALPLTDFIPAQSTVQLPPLRRDCTASMRGYIEYAQEDDDLNYMCLAVKLLEETGLHFTSLDVGLNWLASIPFLWTWGPEHVVYLNLAAAIGEHSAPEDLDLDAITSAFNPGIEWIGAQIRTDVYGYVAPNNPSLAAEYAWRDAYLTHRKSGIYGAMWVAAMNAAAFTLLDMETIIRAGLAQVPHQSRFTEAIEQTIAWCKSDNDWWKTGQQIHDSFGHYGYAGTINNACCVTAALLYGWGDGHDTPNKIFERTITTAVQLGFDTDCNGATAGSVIGLVLGANQIPQKWIAPFQDTLRTCVAQFGQVQISAMAERTYQLSRIVRNCMNNHQ